MTPDDAPALGGQNTDDAPMISSVQTRSMSEPTAANRSCDSRRIILIYFAGASASSIIERLMAAESTR